MLSNIEIKAKVKDLKFLLDKVKAITDKPEVLMKQEDTYFRVAEGRLKLRQIPDQHDQLIFYNRPDVEGPKLSNYYKQAFQNSAETNGLKEVLMASLGVIGVVRKKRQLFMVGQTRVHIDDVDHLGHFMELEVVMKKDQTVEQGQAIADELMLALSISKDDLLSGSYIDLILQKST